MTVEIVGQQLRIRVANPKRFITSSFRTHDVGVRGRLHRIAGKLRSSGEWKTQAWRLNLNDYSSFWEAYDDILTLYGFRKEIGKTKLKKARALSHRWFKNKYGRVEKYKQYQCG